MLIQPLGHSVLSGFWLAQLLNIVIIALAIRMLLKYLWRTPAMPVIGMFLLVILIGNALGQLGFYTFGYLLSKLTPILFVSVVVIFHEEIKDLLGTMGRNIRRIIGHRDMIEKSDIESLVESCVLLRKLHLGGLFVMEREESLVNVYGDPVTLDRLDIDPHVVASILQPPGLLHDGAIIISNGRIVGARAILPLSRKTFFGRSRANRPSAALGTRHRAAIGITEVSDAIAVVVSEETGNFSIAHDGILEENIGLDDLGDRLVELTSEGEVS
ncbi:MAG: diadenylate cyclase [Candidatus Fermentibacteraceae bacterium]|nr:diadenylate cyclase [Candidatus Fermentibacteraceae bacterium]MBN2609355.1 diadenylate cyclase [Candidatus Fermentibacteraceae bacterium]